MSRINSKTPQEITDYDLETIESYDLEGRITDTIKDLQKIHDKYTKKGYHIVWLDFDGDGYSSGYSVCGTRMETPGQVQDRLDSWRKDLARNKAKKEKEKTEREKNDRKLYLKLKKKFGDK